MCSGLNEIILLRETIITGIRGSGILRIGSEKILVGYDAKVNWSAQSNSAPNYIQNINLDNRSKVEFNLLKGAEGIVLTVNNKYANQVYDRFHE